MKCRRSIYDKDIFKIQHCTKLACLYLCIHSASHRVMALAPTCLNKTKIRHPFLQAQFKTQIHPQPSQATSQEVHLSFDTSMMQEVPSSQKNQFHLSETLAIKRTSESLRDIGLQNLAYNATSKQLCASLGTSYCFCVSLDPTLPPASSCVIPGPI